MKPPRFSLIRAPRTFLNLLPTPWYHLIDCITETNWPYMTRFNGVGDLRDKGCKGRLPCFVHLTRMEEVNSVDNFLLN